MPLEAEAAASRSSRSRMRALLAWLAIWAATIAGAIVLSRSVDWATVRSALATADVRWVLAAFLVNLLGLPLWLLAWLTLLPPKRRPPAARLFEAQAVTLAGIQTVSVLGGGAIALFMLVRRAGLSASGAMSMLGLDQLLTGLVKIILIGAAILFAPAPPIMRHAALTLVGVVAILAAAALVAAHSETAARRRAALRSGWIAFALRSISDVAAHVAVIRDPGRFGLALALYLLRRSLEGVGAFCVQIACGWPPSGQGALLVVAALCIATLIPGPPGNVGFYEAAVTFAYVLCGVPPDLALAMALLQHVATLAATALPGYFVALVVRPWSRPRLTP